MSVTTNYGSWYNKTGETIPTASILAVVGDFAADYDLDAVEDAYRDAIEEALPDGVFLTGDQLIGPFYEADQDFDGYPHDEDGQLDIGAIIRDIDLMPIIEQHELWTIDQVARELGVQPGSARGQLSRWGVKRHSTTDSGRPQARYSAAEVKTAKAGRPGSGARTDLAD